MRARFYLWASCLVASMVTSGLCLRALALHGLSYADSLLTRGAASLLLVLIYARVAKLPLRPKSPRVQVLRALLAGLALSFYTLSYQWLSASTVSVLANIDVPLLLILGPWFGVEASRRVRGLALVAVMILIGFMANLEPQVHLAIGLGSLGLGSLLLCFGYLLIKHSMNEENAAITILTPSLAIMAYGALQSPFVDASPFVWTTTDGVIAAISGASMFVAYYATMRLYAVTDIASAEFPTLLAAIIIQPFESLFLGTPVTAAYLGSSLAFTLVIFVIMRWQKQEADAAAPLALPIVAQSLDHTCGAACFASMYAYYRGQDLGEMFFAEALGTLSLGFTPPEAIVKLAEHYNFSASLKVAATLADLQAAFARRDVIFVTWWDEDAGHYSLVTHLGREHIVLMDPWLAREARMNHQSLADFGRNWALRGSKMICTSARQVPHAGQARSSRMFSRTPAANSPVLSHN